MSTFTQLLIAFAALVLAMSAVFTYWSLASQSASFVAGLDRELYAVAVMARDLLPADYHDQIAGPDSVPEAEYLAIVDRYNGLCVQLGLEYIWSLIDIGGKYYFTTATSPDKVAANRKQAAFLELHSNPELYDSTFASMKPVYQINEDKWGRIRVALVPFRDRAGRPYLFGASERLSSLEARLASTLRGSVCAALTLLALGILLAYHLSRQISQPLKRLTLIIGGIASGQGGLAAAIEGTREQAELALGFNRMNEAIKEARALAYEEGEALKASDRRHRSMLQTSMDGFYLLDGRGRLLEVNDTYSRMGGYSVEELLGMRVFDLEVIESAEDTAAHMATIMSKGEDRFETRHRRKDGSVYDIETSVQYRREEGGHFVVYLRDVTERKRAEDQLRRNLEEKEVLLREVHHRVKNNLTLISSLLSLQSSSMTDPEQAVSAFRNSRDRIMAMALVHEEMYRSRDCALVDMGAYLESLSSQIAQTYGLGRDIALDARAEAVSLSVSSAIPCALILNELIGNAYNHAYQGREGGGIRVLIRMAPGDEVELSVSDDGVGMSEGGEGERRGSLGLTLVRLLTEQLEGSMEVSSVGGTAFRIRFPRRG